MDRPGQPSTLARTSKPRANRTAQIVLAVVAGVILLGAAVGVGVWIGRQRRPAVRNVSVHVPASPRMTWEILQDEPRVMLLHNFLSPTECAHMIKLGQHGVFKRSTVQGTDNEISPDRTSSSTALTRHQDALVRKIEERAAAVTHLPLANVEPLQVVRYTRAQFYRPHFDYFVPGAEGTDQALQRGGQRVATLFVYLNDLDAKDKGGSTSFPKLGLKVFPKRGTAVYFPNVTTSGQEDPRLLHGGDPPTCSVKHGLNIWIRRHAFT